MIIKQMNIKHAPLTVELERPYFHSTVMGQMMPDPKDDEIKDLEGLLKEAVSYLDMVFVAEPYLTDDINNFLAGEKLAKYRGKNE